MHDRRDPAQYLNDNESTMPIDPKARDNVRLIDHHWCSTVIIDCSVRLKPRFCPDLRRRMPYSSAPV